MQLIHFWSPKWFHQGVSANSLEKGIPNPIRFLARLKHYVWCFALLHPGTFNLKNSKCRCQLDHKPTFHNKNGGATVKFRANQARFTTHKAETLLKEGDVSDRQRACVQPCKIPTLFYMLHINTTTVLTLNHLGKMFLQSHGWRSIVCRFHQSDW